MTKKEKLILGAVPSAASLTGAGLGYHKVLKALRIAQLPTEEYERMLFQLPKSKRPKYMLYRRLGKYFQMGGRAARMKYIISRGGYASMPALAAVLGLLLWKGRSRRNG